MRFYEPTEMAFAAKLAEFINKNLPEMVEAVSVEFLYGGEETGVGVHLTGDGSGTHAVTVD